MIDWFCDAGADWISFHPEADHHPYRLLQHIQSKGIKAGLAINPGTHSACIEPFLDVLDFVLIMSVNPGFGGQTFISNTLDKIKTLKHMYPTLPLHVDGGITAHNAPDMWKNGATLLVAGSSIFKVADLNVSPIYATAIHALRQG
jgi:ribulose-phosphate 3-epimerase